MPDSISPKFGCDQCGKQFAWKPELAGRKAKCSGCGHVITVPETIARAEDVDEYDFVDDPTPPPAKRAVPAIPVSPSNATPARALAAAPALGYRGARSVVEKQKEDRFSWGAMVHPPRDIYAPTAILIAGFLAIIAWVMIAIDAGALAIMVVSAVTAVETVVKTVVLTIGAVLIAPKFGISFGDFRTAVLKIAAIIVFTDACSIWIDEFFNYAAGGRVGRGTSIKMISLDLFMTGAIISLLCYFLFEMERDETAMFAVPMALISKVVGFILSLVAANVILGMTGIGGGGGGGGGFVSPAGSGGGGSGLMIDGEMEEDEDEGALPATPVDPLAPPATAPQVDPPPF